MVLCNRRATEHVISRASLATRARWFASLALLLCAGCSKEQQSLQMLVTIPPELPVRQLAVEVTHLGQTTRVPLEQQATDRERYGGARVRSGAWTPRGRPTIIALRIHLQLQDQKDSYVFLHTGPLHGGRNTLAWRVIAGDAAPALVRIPRAAAISSIARDESYHLAVHIACQASEGS